MKILPLVFLFLFSFSSFSQHTEEELEAKATIDAFFEAFHKRDSIGLKEIAHTNIMMQSITVNEDGNNKIITESYSSFIKAIVSIPTTTKLEERLLSYDIRVDGPMANVVTPYSFFIDGELKHCGVNNFQLFKESEKWKIVYIIDTRTTKDCSSK
tara:strand:+ start:13650 stop:14114 length:465 start_codon:yes stop_codon:yes gene_type:complete